MKRLTRILSAFAAAAFLMAESPNLSAAAISNFAMLDDDETRRQHWLPPRSSFPGMARAGTDGGRRRPQLGEQGANSRTQGSGHRGQDTGVRTQGSGTAEFRGQELRHSVFRVQCSGTEGCATTGVEVDQGSVGGECMIWRRSEFSGQRAPRATLNPEH